MAFSNYNPKADKHYIADTVADLENIKATSMGETCLVIEGYKKYIANSKGEWVEIVSAE